MSSKQGVTVRVTLKNDDVVFLYLEEQTLQEVADIVASVVGASGATNFRGPGLVEGFVFIDASEIRMVTLLEGKVQR